MATIVITDRAVTQDGTSLANGAAWLESGTSQSGENVDLINFSSSGAKHLYTMRFDISDIPAGATITSASVAWVWAIFQDNVTGIDGVNYIAKDSATSGALTTGNDGWSWRDAANGGTTATATESLPLSVVAQDDFTTTDLSAIIQELVDSYGGSLGDVGITVFPIGTTPVASQFWGVHDNADGTTKESTISITYEELATDQDISPTGISSTLAIGSATVSKESALEINASGIASTGLFGTAVVSNGIEKEITPTGINSSVLFGNANIESTAIEISVNGIASTLVLGVPTITITAGNEILPSGISSTLIFGNPEITNVAIEISATGIVSTLAIGVPEIILASDDIIPVGIASGLVFGDATIQNGIEKEILPTSILSTLNFGNTTVQAQNELEISPSGISSAVNFGTANIQFQSELEVSTSGIASTIILGDPTIVLVRQVDLEPTGIVSTLEIGIPTVEVFINPITVVDAPSKRTFDIEKENRELNIEFENRTFNVLASDTEMKRIKKDPQARLNYSFKLTDWLDSGDSLLSFSIDASSGVVVEAQSATDNIITVVVSGGTEQGEESITCRFMTANGLTDERTIILEMQNR